MPGLTRHLLLQSSNLYFFRIVRVDVHKRIDYIFARLDNTALYFFGQVVGGQECHVGGDDYMQIHVQIAPYVTRAEPVNANHVRAGECHFAQLLGHLGASAFVSSPGS